MIRAVKEVERFSQVFNKLDKNYKERVIQQIKKIIENPEVGKPMRYNRKGTREVYVKPFRLSYSYIKSEETIIFLDLYHKKEQ